MTDLFLMAERGADISTCGRYRYILTRIWDHSKPLAGWVMLNPSTADADKDDPTIRKCIGFAERWGMGGIIVGNLFAFRATNPILLLDVPDPVGFGNDLALRNMRAVLNGGPMIAGWGTNGRLADRDLAVLKMMPQFKCLGVTDAGFPRHPLYLPYNTPLSPYEGRKASQLLRPRSARRSLSRLDLPKVVSKEEFEPAKQARRGGNGRPRSPDHQQKVLH